MQDAENEQSLFFSHARYTNGYLKHYAAINMIGECVDIFDGYTPIQTTDGKFAGYQDKQGRKIGVSFGDIIHVGALNKDGKMNKTKKSFYSVSHYSSLLEKSKCR